MAKIEKKRTYTYLALGDSYTIGEGVPIYESFPYQTIQLLRKSGHEFQAPEIIAKTGWTTDELRSALKQTSLLSPYDFVTLLIGVNNQYRGRSAENYIPEFESLLDEAIQFAAGKSLHVIVLSIPDWSVTPFAEGRDRKQISNEIDSYNTINKNIAGKYRVNYIDITPWTRQAASDEFFLADDKLHPSGREYARWAERLCQVIKAQLEVLAMG